MTISSKTSSNWLIQVLLVQFGPHLHANCIPNSGKMMVAHLLWELRNAWMDSHPLHPINSRYRNQKRSSILCIAVFQQGGFAAKEQPINSLAWCESFHQQFLEQCSCYVVATPACKWGLDWYKTWAILQLHQTKFNPWQVIVLITIIKTFAANGSWMDPLSAPSLPNTHQNWLQLSSILSAHGFRNHHPSIRTSRNGSAS